MSTRLYLASFPVAEFTAPQTGWGEPTSEWSGGPMNRVKTSQPMTDVDESEAETTSGKTYCVTYFTSEPLRAQTITGTVKAYIRAVTSAGASFKPCCVVRVMSGDGATERGVLFSNLSTGGTDIDESSYENRAIPSESSVSSVDSEDGDRLVFEIGFKSGNTDPTEIFCSYSIGDDAASDLGANETDTAADNPWIEFSQTLLFVGDGIQYDITVEADGTASASVAPSFRRSVGCSGSGAGSPSLSCGRSRGISCSSDGVGAGQLFFVFRRGLSVQSNGVGSASFGPNFIRSAGIEADGSGAGELSLGALRPLALQADGVGSASLALARLLGLELEADGTASTSLEIETLYLIPVMYHGQAIPVLTAEPDWTYPVNLKVRYSTKVFEALSLKEERTGHFPRPLYGIDYTTRTLSARETGYLRKIMEGAKALPVTVPFWMDQSFLTADVAAGATVLPVDSTANSLFEVLQEYALVYRNFATWELVAVDSIGPASLAIQGTLQNGWREGDRVVPVAFGNLKRTGTEQATDEHAGIKIEFAETFF